MPHTYSTKGEKHAMKLTALTVSGRQFDGRGPDSPAINQVQFDSIIVSLSLPFFLISTLYMKFQGVITQLSEQISTLNERMDEFTSRVEELNSKFNVHKSSSLSAQNLVPPPDNSNGSGATSMFVSGLGNGTLIPNSSSSNQLAKESPLMEEVSLITEFLILYVLQFQ